MTTDVAQTELNRARTQTHANCVVCGSASPRGLRLHFVPLADGSVQAAFDCGETFEGYAGTVHGGVISAVLDGAMTNCIFAHGRAGLTGELRVRYRHPVPTNHEATVRGWIERASPPLYFARAELAQDGEVKATATGKFMDRSPMAKGG